MNMYNYIYIKISYLISGLDEWKSLELSPHEYFDFQYTDIHDSDIDSVPKYDHAIDYINIDKKEVSATILQLSDRISEERIEIRTSYWNDGNNMIIERRDSGPNRLYYELIYSFKMSERPETYEIFRAVKKDCIFVPVYHGIIKNNTDGSQSETKIKTENWISFIQQF